MQKLCICMAITASLPLREFAACLRARGGVAKDCEYVPAELNICSDGVAVVIMDRGMPGGKEVFLQQGGEDFGPGGAGGRVGQQGRACGREHLQVIGAVAGGGHVPEWAGGRAGKILEGAEFAGGVDDR